MVYVILGILGIVWWLISAPFMYQLDPTVTHHRETWINFTYLFILGPRAWFTVTRDTIKPRKEIAPDVSAPKITKEQTHRTMSLEELVDLFEGEVIKKPTPTMFDQIGKPTLRETDHW